MNIHKLLLSCILLFSFTASTSYAGFMCDWFGLMCDPKPESMTDTIKSKIDETTTKAKEQVDETAKKVKDKLGVSDEQATDKVDNKELIDKKSPEAIAPDAKADTVAEPVQKEVISDKAEAIAPDAKADTVAEPVKKEVAPADGTTEAKKLMGDMMEKLEDKPAAQ